MNNTYRLKEARANLTEIIKRVLAGEEIIITKYNIPIVKIVKIEDEVK